MTTTTHQHSSPVSTPSTNSPAERQDATTEARPEDLVSVIIPTYNRDWSLEQTVRSVFAQTYRPIECLVVDDGSTDNTANVVACLTSQCQQGVELRYIVKENGGANTARNCGLRESRGHMICFLDSDDLLLPDSIEARASILLADRDADLCYGLASVQDSEGNQIRVIGKPWPIAGEARIAPYLMCSSAPLVLRCVCQQAGLWREDDTFGQEFEFFARLKYFSRRVVFIDRVLSIYIRHNKESILDNHSVPFALAIFRMLLAVKALVLYGSKDSPAERKELARMFRSLARQLRGLGDSANACAAAEEALILEMHSKTVVRWLGYKLSLIRAGRGKVERAGTT